MKKHFAHRFVRFFPILLIGFLPVIGTADTIVFTGEPGNWGDTANWFNNTAGAAYGALPNTADTAIMNSNRVADVNSSVATVAGNIIVSNQTDPTLQGTLNVNAGGSLTYDGLLNIASQPTGIGSVNVTGGNLTSLNDGSRIALAAGPSGTFNLSGGTFSAQGSAPTDAVTIRDATVNLSGGTFDFTGGQVRTNNATFNVIGDGATILTDRLNTGIASTFATYNFEFDSDGISAFQSAAWVSLLNATINVDGSAYTGGAGTFVLFASNNLASSSTSLNITGAFPGFDAVFSEADNDVILTLTATGTGGLLGDLDGDGDVDFLDISPFILALSDITAYTMMFPGVDPIAVGDFNGNDVVDFLDISGFVAALAGN